MVAAPARSRLCPKTPETRAIRSVAARMPRLPMADGVFRAGQRQTRIGTRAARIISEVVLPMTSVRSREWP